MIGGADFLFLDVFCTGEITLTGKWSLVFGEGKDAGILDIISTF